MRHQALLSGLVRLHVLHHACEGEIYGQWMIEELARHGYKLSAGTVYPMLHAMQRKGYLTMREEKEGRTVKRLYRATRMGRTALREVRIKLRELFGEIGNHGR